MPHGRLTPLGRQLASVLANLRPASTCLPRAGKARSRRWMSLDNTSGTRIPRWRSGARGVYASQTRRQSAEAAHVREVPGEWTEDGSYQSFPYDTTEDEYGVGRLGGLEKDEISARDALAEDQWSQRHAMQLQDASESYLPFTSLHGKQYPMYYSKQGSTAELRLEELLRRYVEHRDVKLNTSPGESFGSFELLAADKDLLESSGYLTSTIELYAEIVTNTNLHEIVTHLKHIQAQRNAGGVPLFVLFHLLRRPYVSAPTLRVLLRVSFATVEKYHISGTLNKEDLFTLFTLFLRRVRDVSPPAMPSLVDMLLHYLPYERTDSHEHGIDEDSPTDMPFASSNEESSLRRDRLASLTFRLNKAMRLLAIPTSNHPFKTIPTQEACIVRILRFLAEYDPPLEINRDGFRAIILIQLAQPKSDDDKLWAELKTLSWPPWKVDRTAMDADITAAEQGRSKAAETLERMREAGFAPYDWEKVAAIYTGWDTDGTPAIQTRVKFSSGRKRFESGAAEWCARIQTTRTIQEAWACYLAYEEERTEPDQDVCKAMFRKLHEEHMRTRKDRKYNHFGRVRKNKDLWPGDAIEIEPPPPSVHQHTYTRTPPPTFDEFYRQLKEKGVVFEGHCLAYIVSKASSLQLGIEYLAASEPIYPTVRSLFGGASTQDLSSIPDIVFAAWMELLARFSNVSLSKALPMTLRSFQTTLWTQYDFDKLQLNSDHALVHGCTLLRYRLTLYRPAWNSILQALGHSSTHVISGLSKTPVSKRTRKAQKVAASEIDAQTSVPNYRPAYTARTLVRSLIRVMYKINLNIDSSGFIALCNIMENWAVNCWLGLHWQASQDEDTDLELGHLTTGTLDRHQDPRFLRTSFATLVGEDEVQANHEEDHAFKLPELLEVPSPALLHIYVRALGWMRDYQGLLDTVKWMTKYHVELRERSELDRNGSVMMRRTLTALRVFLERSWLRHGNLDSDLPDGNAKAEAKIWRFQGSTDTHSRTKANLARLQTPADSEIVREIRELVESVEEWGGWPMDEEVEEYCKHDRFQQFNR